jgi:hypothetical protein
VPDGRGPMRDAVGGKRLLVVTGAAAADVDALPAFVRQLLEEASEVLVVTPILPGGLQWLVSDTDRARAEADERLDTVLGHVASIAPAANLEGAVGDETPLTAFADAIARFRPDHLLIALRAGDHAAWQERRLVDRVIERFGLPTTVFELDSSGKAPPA